MHRRSTMKKTLAIVSLLTVVTACAAPVNSVSFGKKCEVNGDKMTSSYIWFYHNKTGLPATADQCPPKAKKTKK